MASVTRLVQVRGTFSWLFQVGPWVILSVLSVTRVRGLGCTVQGVTTTIKICPWLGSPDLHRPIQGAVSHGVKRKD